MTVTATELPDLARAAHRVLDAVHSHIYFAPEAGERFVAAGVKPGGMHGYLASRSAPLGRVPAEVVIATFYNFSERTVRKTIPGVWESTTPETVLAARYDAVDASLRRLLGADVIESDDLREAAALAREATTGCDLPGRPLYAAYAPLPWPEPAHLQLWHATTLLREHRGDGHIAALVVAGLSGIEAAVSYVATGKSLPEELLRGTRGYTEEEWQAAKDRLRDRGVLDGTGALTDAGTTLRADIEAQTDRAATGPYAVLGSERTARLRELVRPWARSITQQLLG